MSGLSNAELQKQLKARDAQIDLLTQQVAQLTTTTQELQAELRRQKSTPDLKSRKPLAAAGAGALGGAPGPSGASTSRRPPLSSSPRAASPLRPKTPGAAQTARASTPRGSTPRPASPGMRRAGSFHASMRGGPLTEPAPQIQLTQREREDPYNSLKGPSLLTRKSFGAKKTEWERFKSPGEGTPNLLTDDNPFNDPIKYWPFKGRGLRG